MTPRQEMTTCRRCMVQVLTQPSLKAHEAQAANASKCTCPSPPTALGQAVNLPSPAWKQGRGSGMVAAEGLGDQQHHHNSASPPVGRMLEWQRTFCRYPAVMQLSAGELQTSSDVWRNRHRFQNLLVICQVLVAMACSGACRRSAPPDGSMPRR